MNAPDTATAELPELSFEVARDLGEFPEFALTYGAAEIARYSQATGDYSERYETVVPPGLAAVFGRLGYLRLHRMPGGGVLLGQEIRWLRPAAVGVELRIKSIVESTREDDKGRRMIVFVTTASQVGHVVAQVRIKAGWPS